MYGASTQNNPFQDLHKKSDFDAGIIFLNFVARAHPGLTWDDLANPNFQFMGRSWFERQFSNVASGFGTIKDGIGSVISDTTSFIGDKIGSGVRLASDPNVLNAIVTGASAYATGGASLGMGSFGQFLKDNGIISDAGAQTIEKAGQSAKKKLDAIDWSSPWVIGGGAVLGLGLVYLVVRKK